MTKKNRQYLLLAGVLLAINLFLFLDTESSGTSSFDDKLFSVSDTSQIQKINISNKFGEVKINRGATGWSLNDDYQLDAGFRNTLFAILNHVRVERKVGETGLEKSGTMEVELSGDKKLTFDYFTDGNKTKTFFSSSKGNEYQVSVPGYRDNIARMFDLHPDQWRSRLVYDGNWRTIQKLELTYLNDETEGLSILFKDQFYEISGVNAIDTTFVIDYLNQFQQWQANEMISLGRMERLDSLSKTSPFAKLTIEDINHQKPVTFTLFNKAKNERYYLLKDAADQMFVVDQQRIQLILRKRQDFKVK